jgi:uncharacterized RDD family membrane protein YckC
MIPSFEKRVRAFAIDTSGVALVAILGLGISAESTTLSYVLVGIAFFGFYLFPYVFGQGQTLGKRVQKIKVIHKSGAEAPIWLLLTRDLFKLILSISTYGIYMIVAVFVISNKDGRTIHDYVFQTKVIDLEPHKGKSDILGKSSLLKERGIE